MEAGYAVRDEIDTHETGATGYETAEKCDVRSLWSALRQQSQEPINLAAER